MAGPPVATADGPPPSMAFPNSPIVRVMSPLPTDYREGMIVIAAFGLLSLVSCLGVAVYLIYRVLDRRRKQQPQNQLMILILNLMLADVHQAMGFTLDLHWLRLNKIDISDGVCWGQGWFLGVGNVATAIFALMIGLYTFAFITWRYQMRRLPFYCLLICLWGFTYALPIASVAATKNKWYIPQGPLCSMNNSQHIVLAFWLHNFEIILAIGVTIIVYCVLCIILRVRVKRCAYEQRRVAQARTISKLAFLYPLAYIVCWVPLLSVPISAAKGKIPSVPHRCAGWGLWACVGWLDVVLYTLTRRYDGSMDSVTETETTTQTSGNGIDEGPSSSASGKSNWETPEPLDTFDLWLFPGKGGGGFGTTTHVEANGMARTAHPGDEFRSNIEPASNILDADDDDNEKPRKLVVAADTATDVEAAPVKPRGGTPSTTAAGLCPIALRTAEVAHNYEDPDQVNWDKEVSFKSGEDLLHP